MQLLIDPTSRQLVVTGNDQIAQLAPHALPLDWQGQRWFALPHRQDETLLLRNLGLSVPAPILAHYDWRGHVPAPFASQKETAALLTMSPRAYVLSTMGTGKTRAVLYAADHLMREGLAQRMLVIAPLSTLNPVWELEVWRYFFDRRAVVLHGDRGKRLDRLSALSPRVYVINHHGVEVILDELCQRVRPGDIDIVVIDELSAFRSHKSNLWKSLRRLIKGAAWTWGLTGTPMPKSALDIYAPVKLLTPGNMPHGLGDWKARTMRQVSQFKWLERQGARELAWAAMQPSIRFTREEVVELPPTIYVERSVALTTPQQTVYDGLGKHAVAAIKDGTITAINEAVLRGKLLQVACGWVYVDGEKRAAALPCKPRLDALLEVLGELEPGKKLIVWVPYIHACEGVAAFLREKKVECDLVYGKVGKAERDQIFTRFQNNPVGPRVLVAHPRTAAHGLTLTAASTAIWYAPVDDLEVYLQANARIVRPGQDARTCIVHLTATRLERSAYQRLQKKENMQGLLLELFANQ